MVDRKLTYKIGKFGDPGSPMFDAKLSVYMENGESQIADLALHEIDDTYSVCGFANVHRLAKSLVNKVQDLGVIPARFNFVPDDYQEKDRGVFITLNKDTRKRENNAIQKWEVTDQELTELYGSFMHYWEAREAQD